MKTSSKTKQHFLDQNLSFTNRQIRAVAGATMVIAPMMFSPATMGLWSILLLASIPVLTSAIIGWDPFYALMGKSTYVANEEEIQQRGWTYSNIGIVDRAIRFGIGSMLIFSLLTMSTNAGTVFTLMAIPLIVTAIIAWDPIYAVLRINSFGSRLDVEAAEPENSEETLAEYYIFPQVQQSSGDHYSKAA